MRIGIDMNFAQNDSVFEGIGNYTFSHITHLLDHPDVQLFYFQPNYSGLSSEDFKAELSRFIIQNDIDIFHFPSPMEMPFPEVIDYEQLPQVRFTAVVYDIIPAVFPEVYLQNPVVKHRYFLQLAMLHKLDHLFSISDYTRNDLIRFGFSDEKITTIGIGCEDFFVLTEGGNRAIPFLPENKPYVLAFSPADFRKNARSLIQAFAQMVERAQDNDVQLVFVNHVPEHIREQMHSISADCGLSDRIHLIGRVSKSQLLQIYNRAIGIAFPTLYEGAGLPVLEAMQCAVPVLTSTTTSMPEMVGDAAILVDPHDVSSISKGLEALCFDVELRERLKRRASIQVQQFKWNVVADRTLAEFRKLAARAPLVKREEGMLSRSLIEDNEPEQKTKITMDKDETIKHDAIKPVRKYNNKKTKRLNGHVNKNLRLRNQSSKVRSTRKRKMRIRKKRKPSFQKKTH
ncbi:glycosyltransferase family 4 protein [Paenibacillus alkaliterrae]|uniref:glycosyltransferase family 4 protein n=1 Tax=Paenibacillus alkaliterrae TaxID=320909 RepID=UPI001F1E01DE|nr:glycosyltransferase family 1 protein [Paenibacillus alkaliterrae]MCF2941358.1 glycosyltransferase family 4 protein [Paenibacillus alkaliterrae]